MPSPESRPSQKTVYAAAAAFHKYAPALHRYLVKRIRRWADVQDVMQEVYERYLRMPNVDSVRNPQAYLYGIATHVIGDARLREEHSVVTYDSEIADVAANSPRLATPDDIVDRLGLSQELQRAIAQLPDMHKAVLLLAVRDGLSHREVAQRTGLTEKTVGFYVCEAKARLRTLLQTIQEG